MRMLLQNVCDLFLSIAYSFERIVFFMLDGVSVVFFNVFSNGLPLPFKLSFVVSHEFHLNVVLMSRISATALPRRGLNYA